MARRGVRVNPHREPRPIAVRLLRMTVEPEILYALGTFALIGGRICGGVQWHRWNRERRRQAREEAAAAKTA